MNAADLEKMRAAIRRVDEICREAEEVRQAMEHLATAPAYYPERRRISLPVERTGRPDEPRRRRTDDHAPTNAD